MGEPAKTIRGRIMRTYVIECGRCYSTAELWPAGTKLRAEKRARDWGWRRTKVWGWRCPLCIRDGGKNEGL